nr:P3 [Diaporthe pseudophoenicicola chrysovirus 1]
MSSIVTTIKNMMRVRAFSKSSDTRSENTYRGQFVDAGPDIMPAIVDKLFKAEERINRRDFVAVVMPPGHGKTYLAARYGWVDIDSLLPGRKFQELYESLAQTLITSKDWVVGMKQMAEYARQSLDLICHKTNGVVMVHCDHQAATMGLEIVAKFVLPQELVLQEIGMVSPFRSQFMIAGCEVAARLGAEKLTSYSELEDRLICKLSELGVVTGARDHIERLQWEVMTQSFSPTDMVSMVNRGIMSEESARLWKPANEKFNKRWIMQVDDWVMMHLSRYQPEKPSTTVPHFERMHTSERTQGLANVCRVAMEVGGDEREIAEICMIHDGETEEYVTNVIAGYIGILLSESRCKPLLIRLLRVRRQHSRSMWKRVIEMSMRNKILGWELTNNDRSIILGMLQNGGHKQVRSHEIMLNSPVELPTGSGTLKSVIKPVIDVGRVRSVIARCKGQFTEYEGIAASREGKIGISTLIAGKKGIDAVMAAVTWAMLGKASESFSKCKERRSLKNIRMAELDMHEQKDIYNWRDAKRLYRATHIAWDTESSVAIANVIIAKGGYTVNAMLEVERYRSACEWLRKRLRQKVRLIERHGRLEIEGPASMQIQMALWLAGIDNEHGELMLQMLSVGNANRVVEAAQIDWSHWNQGARIAAFVRCMNGSKASKRIAMMWLAVETDSQLAEQAVMETCSNWVTGLMEGLPLPLNINEFLREQSNGPIRGRPTKKIARLEYNDKPSIVDWSNMIIVPKSSLDILSKVKVIDDDYRSMCWTMLLMGMSAWV